MPPARFVGIMSKYRPSMRPVMIILAALALGLIFLGIVLTIVGHWPGYNAWGGNPLKYVGPVMFALGVIILVGVLVDCCVRSTKEEYAYEKKVFIDVNKTQSGQNTPSVILPITDPNVGNVKQMKEPPAGSAFHPVGQDQGYNLQGNNPQGYNQPGYNQPQGFNQPGYNQPGYNQAGYNGQGFPEVNVLNILTDSPGHQKYGQQNYNNGTGAKVPTPSYPTDPAKKTVGYNQYAYSSDGKRYNVTEEQQKIWNPPQQKSVATYHAPPQPKWGAAETNQTQGSGNKTPPTGGNANGVQSQGGPKNKLPVLQMPNFSRKTKGKDGKDNSAPGSPEKVRKPQAAARSRSADRGGNQNGNQGGPDQEPVRYQMPSQVEPPGSPGKSKWGAHGKKEEEMSPVTGDANRRNGNGHGPTQSTPYDPDSSRDYSSSDYRNGSKDASKDYDNRQYSRYYSDPQGHKSRRERHREARGEKRSYSPRNDGHRRERSSSGSRRNGRNRSRSRDRTGMTRDSVYSTATIDYVTGEPIRIGGPRKGRSRSGDRYGDARDPHGTHRRSRSHDRGDRYHHGNRSYDSDYDTGRRHHRYHDDYSTSHTSGSSRYHRQHSSGVVNPAYDRDISSDEYSPKHKANHSKNQWASADDLLRGAISPAPSNKTQKMNFTINVNAQPGAAVQIALGNQQLPPARPMLPHSITGGPENTTILTELPHDSSIDTHSSSHRPRAVRT